MGGSWQRVGALPAASPSEQVELVSAGNGSRGSSSFAAKLGAEKGETHSF